MLTLNNCFESQEIIKGGFREIGSGFSHVVYERNGIVYKIANDPFSKCNSFDCYKQECDTLEILRKNGFPAIQTIDILAPDKPFPGRWCLTEEYATGIHYSLEDIPIVFVDKVFNFILEDAVKISDDKFSFTMGSHVYRNRNWVQLLLNMITEWYSYIDMQVIHLPSFEKMCELIKKYCVFEDVPSLLLMDANVENYFFKNDQIDTIIDMDHPAFGDPAFQLSSILWKYNNVYFDQITRFGFSLEKKNIIYIMVHAIQDLAFRIMNGLDISRTVFQINSYNFKLYL